MSDEKKNEPKAPKAPERLQPENAEEKTKEVRLPPENADGLCIQSCFESARGALYEEGKRYSVDKNDPWVQKHFKF